MSVAGATRTRPAKVVTRLGDGGETSLGKGARVSKDDDRIEAYGTVDEVNAVIGLIRASLDGRPELDQQLRQVQGDLFAIGADLTMPGEPGTSLRLTEQPMLRLESDLAALDQDLPRLANFILPTGMPAAAYAHLARTMTRRAERRVVTLAHKEDVNPEILRYLNRLSDYLFVLSRKLNDNGARDDLWAPRGLH